MQKPAVNAPDFTPLGYVCLDLQHDINGNALNSWAGNNLQYPIADPVPEPCNILLFGVGLAGILE